MIAEFLKYITLQKVAAVIGDENLYDQFSDNLDLIWNNFSEKEHEFISDLFTFESSVYDEKYLYDYAEILVSWFMNADFTDCESVLEFINCFPDNNKRILLSSLVDSGFSIDSIKVRNIMEVYLTRNNKKFVQSAATFLCVCCGENGVELLKNHSTNKDVSHYQLLREVADNYSTSKPT
jgi:hypothetical protein